MPSIVTQPATAGFPLLIVDDNEDAAESLAILLRLDGFLDVRTAYRGQSALAEAQKQPPFLVVLDLALPGMDGFEVGRRLGHLRPSPWLVAWTGFGSRELRQRAARENFLLFVVKPEVEPLFHLLKAVRLADPGRCL